MAAVRRPVEYDGSFSDLQYVQIIGESQRSSAGDYVDASPVIADLPSCMRPRKGMIILISDVKFTSDNTYVAFATHAEVFIYDSRPLQSGLIGDSSKPKGWSAYVSAPGALLLSLI